ncbi:hypothetical protein ACLESD_30605, partial [Pyxidicoccus sp. 3LFB2]
MPAPSQHAPGRTPDTTGPNLPGTSTPLPANPLPGTGTGTVEGTTPETSTPAPLSACSLPAGLPMKQGSLRSWLGTVPITARGSEGFREPGGTELTAFERAFRELLASGPSAERVLDFSQLGYSLSSYRDDDTGGGWLVLADLDQQRGGGTFIVNLSPARDLWLETPHADSDEGTLRQGAEQLVRSGRARSSSPAPTAAPG